MSIGVVLQLESLEESGLGAVEIHDYFLEHPAIAPLLEGGELLEYGCYLTIGDGPAMVKQELTRPGLIIRGMDLAAGSGLAAAKTIEQDFSAESMARYREHLSENWVGKDMETYNRAPAFLEDPRMHKDYGNLLADIFCRIYNHNLTPRKHLVRTTWGAVKSAPIKITQLAGDVFAALRAL